MPELRRRSSPSTHRERGGASYRARSALVAIAAIAAIAVASCSFPDYSFTLSDSERGGAAGGGEPGVSSGAGGGASAGTADAGNVSDGSGGNAAGAGEEPMAGAAGTGAGGDTNCELQAPSQLPAACSNGVLDGDESAVDCGGTVCHPCFHAETCLANRDCISNECSAAHACVPAAQLETQAIVRTRDTYTLQFRLRFRYLANQPLALKTLAIRYYFARGDTAEPLVPNATQAVLNLSTSVAPETHWAVVRVLEAPPNLTNAYLEVTFTGSKVLLQGDSLELTQSVQSGNAPGRQFDQLTHYSFFDVDSYKLNEHAAVYLGGALAWGTPPPYALPAGCLYTAVNFAGPALTTPEHDFLAGDDPSVQFSGATLNVTTVPFPAPSAPYLPLLQSAIVLDAAHATLRVPNDEYWVYPYVISTGGMNQADLLLQGQPAGTFVAGLIDNAAVWAKLGPYPVTVSKGTLDFSSSGGALRMAGVELFRMAH